MTKLVPKVTLDAEWGSTDPAVERLWMILKDGIKIIWDRAKDKKEAVKQYDEADFWADRIYEKLSTARNHYKTITGSAFSSRPSSEQAGEYDALYAALWSAYKDRFPKLLTHLGYEVGFIFSNEEQFDSQADAFISKYPEFDWLRKYIKLQRQNWQNGLRDQRNAKQHDGDLRDMPLATDINNNEYAKHLFNQVCNVIEGVGICAISYKLPPEWCVITVNENADIFSREPRFKIQTVFEIRRSSSV